MRGASRWLMPYLARKTRTRDAVRRVFIAVADHFEPFHHTDRAGALERMRRWEREFPLSIAPFRDSEGRHPRHTFFYPIEQYDPEILGMLAGICRETGSEVEVHLHHEGDTEDTVRAKFRKGIADFASHDLLSRDATGRPVFCFVHGDWALANSHPKGQCCGVAREIAVLRECGCIADMTFPSAPDATQPRRINDIYYTEDTGLPESLSVGPKAKYQTVPYQRGSDKHLLLVQGVVALNWQRRKLGLLPRLENSDLTLANPPTADRWNLWLRNAPAVSGKEDWVFIKLHTHGGTPRNSDMLLGPKMREFRSLLAAEKDVSIHYVTAREMVNVIHALEDGAKDYAPELLNHHYAAPPGAAAID